jgi:hypothetical protein
MRLLIAFVIILAIDIPTTHFNAWTWVGAACVGVIAFDIADWLCNKLEEIP